MTTHGDPLAAECDNLSMSKQGMLTACSTGRCGLQVLKARPLHAPNMQYITADVACRRLQLGAQSVFTQLRAKGPC